MGLPPLDELFKPVTCFPPWYARYLPFERNTPRIASGSGVGRFLAMGVGIRIIGATKATG